MAHVNVAIRIGRAIMQNELFTPRTRIAQGTVKVLLLPPFKMPGSFCGRPAFMGKSVFGRKTVGRKSRFSVMTRRALAIRGDFRKS
jgi:hypothetical protein